MRKYSCYHCQQELFLFTTMKRSKGMLEDFLSFLEYKFSVRGFNGRYAGLFIVTIPILVMVLFCAFRRLAQVQVIEDLTLEQALFDQQSKLEDITDDDEEEEDDEYDSELFLEHDDDEEEEGVEGRNLSRQGKNALNVQGKNALNSVEDKKDL